MNCLFIETRTLVQQPRGYAPPLGLVVYDLPLFTWMVCDRAGYYESNLFRRLGGWPYLTDCAVWLFDGATKFRKGGRFKVEDDTFVIEYDLAGGTYATERLSVDDVLHSGAYDASTTRLPKPSKARKGVQGADALVPPFRGALRAWLTARKTKLDVEDHASSMDPVFFGLDEE
jgi:hypothetical protein